MGAKWDRGSCTAGGGLGVLLPLSCDRLRELRILDTLVSLSRKARTSLPNCLRTTRQVPFSSPRVRRERVRTGDWPSVLPKPWSRDSARADRIDDCRRNFRCPGVGSPTSVDEAFLFRNDLELVKRSSLTSTVLKIEWKPGPFSPVCAGKSSLRIFF